MKTKVKRKQKQRREAVTLTAVKSMSVLMMGTASLLILPHLPVEYKVSFSDERCPKHETCKSLHEDLHHGH